MLESKHAGLTKCHNKTLNLAGYLLQQSSAMQTKVRAVMEAGPPKISEILVTVREQMESWVACLKGA